MIGRIYKGKTVIAVSLIFLVLVGLSIRARLLPADYSDASDKKPSYMIYYGALNEEIISMAKTYDVVIIHPRSGDLKRSQIQEIQKGLNVRDPKDDVKVIGYISIGEDLRTSTLSDEQMLEDPRFTGNKKGPRVDPRGRYPDSAEIPRDIDSSGSDSPGGSGYASWYLDDNDFNGKPDRNKYFGGAFVNAGDPGWFEVLDKMTLDGLDGVPGLAEILTESYGRGLGCDGIFLDTIDTCAPNYFTDEKSGNQSEFEWTAPGFSKFITRLKEAYPHKLIVQNRGLFFFNPRQQHYKFCTGSAIDYLLVESYRLNSNTFEEYNEVFFKDNKYNYMPRIMAEANRPDGFKVLSMGYAEGPAESKLKESLLGKADAGIETLLQDIRETQDIAGFSHYITDSSVTLVNNFVKNNTSLRDDSPPVWSSTYNDNTWPPRPPKPRIGIQDTVPRSKGVLVRWDVALDKNGVKYVAYYQTKPFDFKNDPDLTSATRVELEPTAGEGYATSASKGVYPYQALIKGLTPGRVYYFVIRAVDKSRNSNEEKNRVFMRATPLD